MKRSAVSSAPASSTSRDQSSRALARYFAKSAAARRFALAQRQQLHERHLAHAFPARDRRRVEALAQATRDRWHRENAAANDNFASAAARQVKLRRELDRQLRREIPHAAKVRQLQRAARKVLPYARDPLFEDGPIVWGPWEKTDDVARKFTTPYPSAVSAFFDDDRRVKENTSFCRPEIGQFAHNFTYEHNENGWFSGDTWSEVDASFSLGAHFQLPWAGRVRVTGEVQNLANRLVFSATDNFGISNCAVGVEVYLLLALLHGGNLVSGSGAGIYVKQFDVPEGGSLNVVNLDNTHPYHGTCVASHAIAAGEWVSGYAGMRVRFTSLVDDMHLHARVTYWWQLNKLVFEVV